jgi:hypothetical protein
VALIITHPLPYFQDQLFDDTDDNPSTTPVTKANEEKRGQDSVSNIDSSLAVTHPFPIPVLVKRQSSKVL